MAKSKKAKAKGGPKSLPYKAQTPAPRNTGKGGNNYGSQNENGVSPFTLQSIARASQNNQSSPWSSSANLRNQRMHFVSGGGLEGMEKNTEPPSTSQSVSVSNLPDSNIAGSKASDSDAAGSGGRMRTTLFDKDQYGDNNIVNAADSKKALGDVMPVSSSAVPCRSLSPARSESSEEVVVFRGRPSLDGHLPTQSQISPSGQPINLPALPDGRPPDVSESHVHPWECPDALLSSTFDNVKGDQARLEGMASRNTLQGGRQGNVVRDDKHAARQRPRDMKREPFSPSKTVEDFKDEIYADYIANIRENSDSDPALPNRKVSAVKRDLDGWHPSDIQDFDGLSTSEEILEGLEQVLSKRARGKHIQYLVVWNGQTVDDARWINQSALTMDGAAELIARFEKEDPLRKDSPDELWETEDEDEDEDEGEDEDLDDEFQDELDLTQRRVDRMTDEQIARLLAKQEELGMGSDELLLFDHDIDDDSDGDDDDDDIEDMFGFRYSRHAHRHGGKYRSASHFADGLDGLGEDYGDFDVMDHNRPSLLRAKNKGHDPVADLGLSDSSLEAELRASWTADKTKKKRKKQEREELRAQGLLGKKARVKPDFSAKYKNGMSIQMVRQELETFLDADYESRPFPPMDKRDRKVLHHFANAFNLKSKSQGKGSNRFTVVFKTSRTIPFDDDAFDRIAAKLERQFWPTPGGSKGKKNAGQPRTRAGGVGGWNVREGQMVGAGAPELGSENRGRAMLEKMGWTKGRALGTIENQGILLPIEHMVKTSKTGLG